MATATVRTATGLTTVESWTSDLNPSPVYNIGGHAFGVRLFPVWSQVARSGSSAAFDETRVPSEQRLLQPA